MAPAGPVGVVAPLEHATLGEALSAVGPTVDALYPAGLEKLGARCQDALAGRARGHVVLRDRAVVGFAMESPKGARALKLSTIWIHPAHRGIGVGTALVSRLMLDWLECGLERVHVTVRLGSHRELVRALGRLGFEAIGIAPDRYGASQHELVLMWEPPRAPDETWLDFRAHRLAQLPR